MSMEPLQKKNQALLKQGPWEISKIKDLSALIDSDWTWKNK